MGCGASKAGPNTAGPAVAPAEQQSTTAQAAPPAAAAAAAAAPAPALAAETKPRGGSKVQVVSSASEEDDEMIVADDDAVDGKPGRDVHSANSNDSGINSDDYDESTGIITENTEGGEQLASTGRPRTPEFELAGTSYHQSQDNIREQSAASTRSRDRKSRASRDLDSAVSRASTITTQSAPMILERPKSRGGMAFDVVYDDEGPAKARMPARLKAIERKSERKASLGREVTLAELEAKLNAAEKRRSEYEKRVKAKMLEETQKVENASRSMTRQKSTLDATINKSEDKATQNREKHLKDLRDKLKAKEKKAEQVRKNKAKLLLQEKAAPAITA